MTQEPYSMNTLVKVVLVQILGSQNIFKSVKDLPVLGNPFKKKDETLETPIDV